MDTSKVAQEMSPDREPFSGIGVRQVYSVQQQYELVEPSEDLPEERQLSIKWDWRITTVPEFEVIVGVLLGPSKEVPEKVEAVVAGRFFSAGMLKGLTPRGFARFNALSFLLPYAREVVSSLTGRGPYGAVALPPVNAQRIAEGFNEEMTTAARQAEADPEIKNFYDIAPATDAG